MMERRSALTRLALGMLGSMWAFVSCGPLRRSHQTTTGKPFAASAEELRRDLERLGQRTYSEQGIPMFLVCENLAPDEPTGNVDGRDGTRLAENLRRTAETFRSIRPNATEGDVPKLLELLAERDFGMTLTNPQHHEPAP
jgi:hypothetical protein